MREFVYGSEAKYNLLKETLNDHLCHVYMNCTLPSCCSKQTARIGFEKGEISYILYIDKGISCSKITAPALFKEWLFKGTLLFMDFSDIKAFLRSLKCLY